MSLIARFRHLSSVIPHRVLLVALAVICAGVWAGDSPAPVPKSGQTVSYAAHDDGALRAGVPLPIPRFTDNRNGTVTDHATGLVWLKNPRLTDVKSWTQAMDFCANLASGQAGLSDGSSAGQWRLPTSNEALSLIDYDRYSPALPEGHPFDLPYGLACWTGTSCLRNTAGPSGYESYYVNYGTGSLGAQPKQTITNFWPVRDATTASSPPLPVARTGAVDIAGYTEHPREDAVQHYGVPWPVPRFSDLGDGTVRDHLTGLIWLKKANPFGDKTWANALASCAALANGQHGLNDGSKAGDWRLPNVREMRSLISMSSSVRSGTAKIAVPDTQGTGAWSEGNPFTGVTYRYWSSTTWRGLCQWDGDKPSWNEAFQMDTMFGQSVTVSKLSTMAVWPVRGGLLGPPPVAAPIILRQPFQQVAYVGDTVVFPVTALANNGTYSYQWRFNGAAVGTNSPQLVLEPVTSTHMGNYSVVVSNSAGSVTSVSVSLIVVDAPPDNGRRAPVAQAGHTGPGVVMPTPRFTDNGDGTITDRGTGLIWHRQPVLLGKCTWLNAFDICSSLSHGRAGLADGSIPGQWRLPTRAELHSLKDYDAQDGLPPGHPFVNMPSPGGTPNYAHWWSSTVLADSAREPRFFKEIWVLSTGAVSDGISIQIVSDLYGNNFVWPVRQSPAPGIVPVAPVPRTGARQLPISMEDAREDGITRRGIPWPEPRFTDMGDGTIRDNLTNLYWLKDAHAFGAVVALNAGQAAASALSSGQYGLSDGSKAGDWRIPTIREIDSLVSAGWGGGNSLGTPDKFAVPDTSGSGYWKQGDPFLNLQAEYYLASTGYAGGGTTSHWGIELERGQLGLLKSIDKGHIWPVRNGIVIANDPPVISAAKLSGLIIAPGGTVTLTALASDDGKPNPPAHLTYTWSVASGPTVGVSFGAGNGGTAASTLTVSVANAGTYIFRVTVSDGQFSSRATTSELLVTTATNPGTIAFVAPATFDHPEGDSGLSTVTLTVNRTGGLSGAVSVAYAVQAGTASPGSDFIAASGTLNWAAGDSAPKTITVSVLGDTIFESNEQFTVALARPSGGAVLGMLDTASVTITNDDQPPSAGVFSFELVEVRVPEMDAGSTTATLAVIRRGGSAGAVSVHYATANGTAQAGSDYTTVSGTLNWAAGDTAVKTITVPILGDTASEPDETLTVTLSAPTGGVVIGTGGGVATLTIVDDDAEQAAGYIAFVEQTLRQAEGHSGQTAVTVQVERAAGTKGAVSVHYASSDGTATAGSDYVAATGTLSWADGESGIKSFTLQITGDTAIEPDETLTITLSNPTGNVAVRAAQLVVTIANDDVGVAPARRVTLKKHIGSDWRCLTAPIDPTPANDSSVFEPLQIDQRNEFILELLNLVPTTNN